MTPFVVPQPQAAPTFESEEEKWFEERDRKKVPEKSSPSTPPPALDDPLADTWFR